MKRMVLYLLTVFRSEKEYLNAIIMLEGFMKRWTLIILAVAIFFVTVLPAVSYARGPRYYRHGWGPRPHYYRPYYGGWNMAGAAAGGFLLGAVIGSSVSRPAYVVEPAPVYVLPPPPPPRVYYYPPPARVYVYP